MKKLALALAASSVLAGVASADINTGFYLGAGIGGNATTYGDGATGLGRHSVDGTVYAGYGFVSGCTYLGAELGYTFTGGKTSLATISFERKNVFNAAFLVGQKFTPSTMGYIRLGANYAQFKTTSLGDSDTKRKLSFAPGLGLETAVNKNVRIRLQYVYDFGAKFNPTVNGVALGDIKARTQSVTLGVAYKF